MIRYIGTARPPAQIRDPLIAYGGDARTLRPREQRAWDLAEAMLDSDGFSPDALVSDVDEGWSGSA